MRRHLRTLHTKTVLAWARVNDPLGALDPFTPCSIAGHDYRWTYDLGGHPQRCVCVREGCERAYWNPS